MRTRISPLLGTRTESTFLTTYKRNSIVFIFSAIFLGMGVVFILQESNLATWTALRQTSKAPLLYVPHSVIKAKAIPLHIQVPIGKEEVEYTLVESPISSLHNYMLDEINATNSTEPEIKCTLEGVTIDGNEQAQINTHVYTDTYK